MPAPYSMDLRWRIVHACERGTVSQREVAEFCEVGQATVENIWRLYRRTGEVAPQRLHRMGAPARADEKAREQLRRSLQSQPDMTLVELQEELVPQNGIPVSTSRICRILQEMGLRRKKKNVHAAERDIPRVRQARRRDRRTIAKRSIRKLRFIDETGVNLGRTRRFGRAAPGERVQEAALRNTGRNVTILGALSWTGLDAVMTVEGATDTAVFRAYVCQVLAPTRKPDDVVVMDNLSAHQVVGVEAAITARGAELIYLPLYSPDCSPIESCWSKLKIKLRSLKARTREELDEAIRKAMNTICKGDARGWFAHCGYILNN